MCCRMETIEFMISDDMAYRVDSISGDPLIELEMADEPVDGSIEVLKTGEKLTGFVDNFVYTALPLESITFSIVADEDILTPDGQKDAEGNRRVLYKKGTKVQRSRQTKREAAAWNIFRLVFIDFSSRIPRMLTWRSPKACRYVLHTRERSRQSYRSGQRSKISADGGKSVSEKWITRQKATGRWKIWFICRGDTL